MRKYKGQINFEFLGAAILYLLFIGAMVTAFSGVLPNYDAEAERVSLNLEAQSVTNSMLSEPGSHNQGQGGDDWEQNPAKVENIEKFGLAEGFLQLDRDKIGALSTTGQASNTELNYTMFREVTDVDNQYRFNFTHMPIAHAEGSFTRESPPENDPEIVEPEDDGYDNAENQVYYGSIDLEGEEHGFLIAAHNGTYDAAYNISDTDGEWDFSQSEPKELNDEIGSGYTIESFQNRENEEGNLMILSKHVNTFGASLEDGARISTMTRFAELEEEPLKMEVWTW